MKLRLRENSIRLRLLQSEVKTLGKRGSVSETISFAASQKLVYTLRISEKASDIGVRFESGEIIVEIPARAARSWIETDAVGLEHEQKVAGETNLKIIVEKDSVCVERPLDPDNADAFPHPQISC